MAMKLRRCLVYALCELTLIVEEFHRLKPRNLKESCKTLKCWRIFAQGWQLQTPKAFPLKWLTDHLISQLSAQPTSSYSSAGQHMPRALVSTFAEADTSLLLLRSPVVPRATLLQEYLR